ncbi:Taf5, partial [Symbiodinium microadriaticum]
MGLSSDLHEVVQPTPKRQKSHSDAKESVVDVADSDDEHHRPAKSWEDRHRAFSANDLLQQSELERAAVALLRKRGYIVSEAASRSKAADGAIRRKVEFGNLAAWVNSTMPPLRDELRAALAPLLQHMISELMDFQKVSAARQLLASHESLLHAGSDDAGLQALLKLQDEELSCHFQQQKPAEVVLGKLAQHLLLSRLSSPEMLPLATLFFNCVHVRVRAERAETHATAAAVPEQADEGGRAVACFSALSRLPAAQAGQHQSSEDRGPSAAAVLIQAAQSIHFATASPNTKHVVAGCGHDLVLWSDVDLSGAAGKSPPRGVALSVRRGRTVSAAFHPSADFLVSGGQDGDLRLWNTATGTPVHAYRCGGTDEPVWCLDWSPLGQYFLSGTDGETALWSVEHACALRVLGSQLPRPSPVRALRVHPSGRLAAVATRERVCLWDLASAAPAQELQLKDCTALAFSPDGSILACGSSNMEDSLMLWQLASNRTSSHKHGGAVSALCFAWPGFLPEQDRNKAFLCSGVADEMRMHSLSVNTFHDCWDDLVEAEATFQMPRSSQGTEADRDRARVLSLVGASGKILCISARSKPD